MLLFVLVLANLLIGFFASKLRKNVSISKVRIPFDVIGEGIEITIQ